MVIPDWFKRELKMIDPAYRAETEDGLVAIIKDVDVELQLESGRKMHVKGPRTIDVFTEPNDKALERLRERKYVGQRMKIVEDPLNELRWLKSQQDEAKKKKEQLAIDMMAEGLVKMHRFENTTTVVMPGEKNAKSD